MPTRSGSLTSRRNACVSRWSSKRRLIMVQSSKPKAENSGSPPPTSRMSSTPNTSSFSKSAFPSSFSSSSSSASSSSFFSSTFVSSFVSSIFATPALSSSPSFCSFCSSFMAAASAAAFSFFSLAAAAAFSLASFAASLRAFFASFAAFSLALVARATLYWFCFARHACTFLCQSFHLVLNHSPGVRSSTRVVSFRSWTHCFRYALAGSTFCHS
mmetsp:Transcript_69250/g.195224  ORF Transcript_69250/g.195224 Transcript_69250/m.195224 type:complete len:214 (-) Transcript_69250:402-1043(-)